MQHASHSCLRALHQYAVISVSERGVIEDELIELMEDLLESIAPGVPDHYRIGIGSLYPLVVLDFVDLVDYEEIKRVAHGEVALYRRVKGHERALQRVLERGVEGNYAVKNRLAVLGLSDLEIRRVDGRADEVALGVDIEKPCVIALDIASDQDGAAECDVLGELAGVTGDNVPYGFPYELRGLACAPV